MRIAVVIPVYNEEQFIEKTLDSLLSQSHGIASIVVVNDNSTDHTAALLSQYGEQIKVVDHISSNVNIPGAKVVTAFNFGLRTLQLSNYDIICKFDGDLIFPLNYMELIVSRFRESENIGIVAGHCTILENEEWIVEKGTNPDHVRGALKAYRVACFNVIGGIKTSIGWDTADEMIARYHGWKVNTIAGLHVKHLKPTGAVYRANSQQLQGEAFYKLRYGVLLTLITTLKMSLAKKKVRIIPDYLNGYFRAKSKNLERLVTADQGSYIRSYRWNGIYKKLGIKN